MRPNIRRPMRSAGDTGGNGTQLAVYVALASASLHAKALSQCTTAPVSRLIHGDMEVCRAVADRSNPRADPRLLPTCAKQRADAMPVRPAPTVSAPPAPASQPAIS